MNNQNNAYKEKFEPKAVLVGNIILPLSQLIFFVPFLALWFVYDVQPDWPMLVKALVPWLVLNIPWWISYPISYVPILGVPGTLLCFLSGNIANMRIPAVIAAQKASKTEMGTEEGSIMAIIGLAMSVYVNLIILALGVLTGDALLSALPSSISSALNYLLPALFGCILAMFLKGNVPATIVSVASAVILTLLYNKGTFAFIPMDVSIFVMLIPIILAVATAITVQRAKNAKENDDEAA